MNDEFTVEGIAALLNQLAAIRMERDELRLRAEHAEEACDIERLRAEAAEMEVGRLYEQVRRLEAERDELRAALLGGEAEKRGGDE